jgi:hypothetical protein
VPIKAVIDTSTLVRAAMRKGLTRMAQAGTVTAIWSPWIIAELNRVLTGRWIREAGGDLSTANERRCSRAAKTMMDVLLGTFTLAHPAPPYPLAWEGLTDAWDVPIWAAAVASEAQYVVSENTRDFPPRGADGRHIYEGIEYVTGDAFIALLTGSVD